MKATRKQYVKQLRKKQDTNKKRKLHKPGGVRLATPGAKNKGVKKKKKKRNGGGVPGERKRMGEGDGFNTQKQRRSWGGRAKRGKVAILRGGNPGNSCNSKLGGKLVWRRKTSSANQKLGRLVETKQEKK